MKVEKFLPGRSYGFVQSDEGRVFFHLGVFYSGDVGRDPLESPCDNCSDSRCGRAPWPVPPIVGEEVDVDVDLPPPASGPDDGKAPKAISVTRVDEPRIVEGVVESFDVNRGYGFIQGRDGQSYHLHRSEVRGGLIPLEGSRVVFYAGFRQDRPRACHVTICSRS